MASGSTGLFRFNELGVCRALELGPHVVTMEMPRTSIGIAILSCTLAIITVIVIVSTKKKASLGASRYRNGGRGCLVKWLDSCADLWNPCHRCCVPLEFSLMGHR